MGAYLHKSSSMHPEPIFTNRTSYRKFSWRLEATRLDVLMIVSLRDLTGISAALLPRCLSNFRGIGKVEIWISRLRDFTRSCGKTSVCLVNRSHGLLYTVHCTAESAWWIWGGHAIQKEISYINSLSWVRTASYVILTLTRHMIDGIQYIQVAVDWRDRAYQSVHVYGYSLVVVCDDPAHSPVASPRIPG